MTLLAFLLSIGALMTLTVAAIVYANGARRNLPLSHRYASAISAGTLSFGGFLAPHLFSDRLT